MTLKANFMSQILLNNEKNGKSFSNSTKPSMITIDNLSYELFLYDCGHNHPKVFMHLIPVGYLFVNLIVTITDSIRRAVH